MQNLLDLQFFDIESFIDFNQAVVIGVGECAKDSGVMIFFFAASVFVICIGLQVPTQQGS